VEPSEFYRKRKTMRKTNNKTKKVMNCRAPRAPTRWRRKKAVDATCATRSASASTAAARLRSRRARDSYRPRCRLGATRLLKASRASQRV